MATREKLLHRLLDGGADANIAFDDLRALLRQLGFEETIRGSHHVFRRPDVAERVNLQGDRGKAKVYQVRQVRRILITNRLTGGD
jgi:predicted RNA binding protein YcfA (HicA-like mRNA interferase family)